MGTSLNFFFGFCSKRIITLDQFYLKSCTTKNIFSKAASSFRIIERMPKEKKISQAGKETKEKNKNSSKSKSSRFPPSEIYLCILGNGSVSSSRALYMVTDHQRYLFNCGEGTQRLASEHKMKLSKVENIFITHKSWENLGGLLGLSLTVQDMGIPQLTLHGPPGLDSLCEIADSFIFLNDLDIATKGYEEKSFTDDCMDVQYIPVLKPCSSSKFEMNSSLSECDINYDDCEEPRAKKMCLASQNSDVIVSYACKGHAKLGHLMFDKCVDLGVPSGPLLGELKNGKDVVLPSGRIILSKDVVSPVQECPLFLVVECPSEEFLDPFVNEKNFIKYQRDTENIASLVVHFTPPKMMKSAKYQDWIKRFPDSTCHLILNSECPTLNSPSIHRIQHHLNLLHPGIFSLLQENEEEEKKENIEKNIFRTHTLDRYFLRPAKGFDRSLSLKIDPKDFIEEAMNTEGFKESLEQLQNKIKDSNQQINGQLYPEVAFLGTGSSIPNKVRNVTSILLNTSKNKYMLLDCGEGTYGQLFRLYGKACENILLNFFSIFISHMHADHHLGLITLLKERENLLKQLHLEREPLLIVGPIKLNYWLKDYYKNFETSVPQYRFVTCSSMEHDEYFNSTSEQSLEQQADIILSTVPVNHCPDAHGAIILSKSSGWKLVYSGDTAPCQRLVSAGKDCSLLIHEATMEDELAQEASFKRHSTTSEAIKIGEEMNSKYTILTHFSQRYAKVPLFSESFHSHIGCAFDNMKVRLNELYILPLLIPPLKTLFAEYVEDLHIKGDKRRKKMELIKNELENSILKKSVQENG